MRLSLTFADSGYPDVLFIATENSLVREAIEAAAGEWDMSSEFLELSYCGNILQKATKLVSYGLVTDSQLTVSLLQWINKDLLTNDVTREKVGMLITKGILGDQILHLDTPTFTDDDGCLTFDKEWIPNGVHVVCFDNPQSSVATVARGFLKGSSLKKIDLVGLQHITSVGDCFLTDCNSLSALDTSSLINLTAIGEGFLSECGRLSLVDLSPLRNITSTGDGFLGFCTLLSSVDLPTMNTVGNGFLACCEYLPSLDLRPLSTITAIGDGFLSFCQCLSALDLSPLSNLTSVGGSFLAYCENISSVDFSQLKNLTSVGDGFASGCSLLSSLDLSPLINLTSIGDDFLGFCGSLTSLHLPPVDKLTHVGIGFLQSCSLTSLSFSELDERQEDQSIDEKIALYLKWVEEKVNEIREGK